MSGFGFGYGFAGSIGRGGGGVPGTPNPYDPSSLNNIKVWLKPESIAEGAGVGIANWADSSGQDNPAVQATEALRPVVTANAIDGYKAARFATAGADWMDITPLTLAQAGSFYTLVATPSNSAAIFFDGITNENNRWSLYTKDSDPQQIWTYAGSEYNSGKTIPRDSSFHLIEWKIDGAASRTFVDGVSTGTGSTGGYTLAGLRMGIGYDGVTNPLNGWICEVLLYNQHQDDTDRTEVYNYFDFKYPTLSLTLVPE